MKKSLGKVLPALAFVFAMAAAFVTHALATPPVGTLKAKINGNWTPISESQSYNCLSSSDDCVARFDQQDQMIPGTLVPGTYVAQ